LIDEFLMNVSAFYKIGSLLINNYFNVKCFHT
jgi:hypothetical protein